VSAVASSLLTSLLAEPSLAGDGPGLGEQLARTFGGLAVVLALLYGGSRVALGRLRRARGGDGRCLRLLERLSVDARHALVLVEVGDRRLLLATGGPAGLRVVARLRQPDAPAFDRGLDRATGPGARS
jgi:hypothetical protein